jgi:hypothetical protein
VPAANFGGIYAILKQKSKHNFSWEMTEPQGFLSETPEKAWIGWPWFGPKCGKMQFILKQQCAEPSYRNELAEI